MSPIVIEIGWYRPGRSPRATDRRPLGEDAMPDQSPSLVPAWRVRRDRKLRVDGAPVRRPAAPARRRGQSGARRSRLGDRGLMTVSASPARCRGTNMSWVMLSGRPVVRLGRGRRK